MERPRDRAFNGGGGWDVSVVLVFCMSSAILVMGWRSWDIIYESEEIVMSAFAQLRGME